MFRNKMDEKGRVTRNKARLVVNEYTREEGIYYNETFVPIARLEAIKLAYVYFHNFKLFQTNVKVPS